MRCPHLHIATLVLMVMFSSCLNIMEAPVVGSEDCLNLTDEEAIAAAKAYYDKQVSRIVCGEGDKPMWPWQAKPHAPYDLGEYEVVWESGYIKNYPGKIHVDFDIIKEHDFIYFPDTCNHYSGMKLRSRFVSVQTPDTIVQYIATYIPHEAYYDRYYTVRHGGGSIGLLEVNFSGRELHTTLEGYHYAAYRVWQGEITKKIELYNAPIMTMRQRYEEFFNIMEGYHLGVCKLSEEVVDTSTLTEDDVANVILIEEISIVAPKPKLRIIHFGTIYKYTPDLSSMNEYVKFYNHLGGGGGGSSSSNDDEEGDNNTSDGTNGIDGKTPEEVSEDIFNNYGNLADSVKTKVNTMIAEIAADCMGKELLSRLMGNNVNVKFGTSSEGNSRFGHKTNEVIMVNNYSEVLLHELFHAYQYNVACQKNVSTYEGLIRNFEAEAYVAMYFFMDRSLSIEMSSRKKRFSKRNIVGIDATKAADCLTYQGYINEWDVKVENRFKRHFRNAALSAVKNNNIFFNETRSIDENIGILRILSQKCNDL